MSQFTVATSRELTLGQLLLSTGSDTSITLNSSETITASRGVLKIGSGDEAEWVYFGGLTNNGDGTYTATSCVRGLNYDATSTSDATDANKKDHAIGDIAEMVLHSVDVNEYVQNDADTTITGDNTFTGTNTFSGISKVLFVVQNVTTAQRDLLTGVDVGAKIYNTTDDQFQVYNGSSWNNIPYGAVYEFAKESQKGVVEVSTVTDQQNATSTGTSGAGVVLRTEDLVTTSSGASDAYKVGLLNSDGEMDESLLSLEAIRFGGDGSDGALNGATTITGSGYVVKNYSSMTPGAVTIDSSATNLLLHIKCLGDCDLTGTTFDLKGHGGTGGNGGTTNLASNPSEGQPGQTGMAGNSSFVESTGGDGGDGGTNSGAGSDALSTNSLGVTLSIHDSERIILCSAGSGGGGGGGGYNPVKNGGAVTTMGGNGGNGGAGLILEVRGNLTFSGTTIDIRGNDGTDGLDGEAGPNLYAGGGGGGGGGGMCVIMYSGTVSGSPTVQSTGGTGGSLGGIETAKAGGGGAGGTSIINTGDAGSSGNGGDGGDGGYILVENQVFA